jgi:DNA-binding PadR family transcriptional regulator
METIKAPSTTEYAVLGLLAFGERSGYDLTGLAARSIDAMGAPSRSQIYKVLPRLQGRGWAAAREVEQRGRPDKALYRITGDGRAALRAWVEAVDEEADAFLLKLFFAWVAPPEAAHAQLAAYRRVLERRLASYEETERGLEPGEPVHSRLALRHGIARARATLAWADEAERSLPRGPG